MLKFLEKFKMLKNSLVKLTFLQGVILGLVLGLSLFIFFWDLDRKRIINNKQFKYLDTTYKIELYDILEYPYER